MKTHDLIGIGFGPSNVALAIALEEQSQSNQPIDAIFIEKQPQFAWHKNMLIENTDMQISFLKDLVSLRNPRSHYTFTNYLHQKGRLQEFINLKTFFPSRLEFNDYLSWAAGHFTNQSTYGETVLEILPEKQGMEVSSLRVISEDNNGRIIERKGHNLVLGVGGSANIPDCFKILQSNPNIFHSSQYLRKIEELKGARRIAIIGAGQSAAEIFLDLHGRANAPQVDLIMRGRAMHPSDDSPSVNAIFDAEFTDYVYDRSPIERKQLLEEFHHTNYAAPDIDQIDQIFQILYNQKVSGQQRHKLLNRHAILRPIATDNSITLELNNLDTQEFSSSNYDAVILATGYTRQDHKALLAPLAPYLQDFSVDRNYRLNSTENFKPSIFLQGACEDSHGLSDTLLSVMAVRSKEISTALSASQRKEVKQVYQEQKKELA